MAGAHRFVLLVVLWVPAGAKPPAAFLGQQQCCCEDRDTSGMLAQSFQESTGCGASCCHSAQLSSCWSGGEAEVDVLRTWWDS